ncbi:PAS domain-containing protein [Mesorhizobium sp. M7A.F.Ce.TU.012.03.2.1]|uniref:PAS domain-containing protein n=1 Tax=Mesorhizobium sp. M7A.F.Ce.TU.012.03.2.1 TaxID=2493681 RepID=UPI000FD9B8C7|nr:PAS domain-containing protein [Mesorhizobium sp. M7A.F.Ce.TU.012.03.2.1]AZV19811.1 PAS domain S-box protein [Mesorhizobium sp. M7A.F.Ce.TU.012.03.2.1]
MKMDLGRVLYALPGLVWTALRDGRIDFVNRQWAEYTGLGLDEAHGSEWKSIVHPDDLPSLLERWQSMSEAADLAELEVRLRRFDGVYRRFLVRCSPIFDAEGQVERWCGVGTELETRQAVAEGPVEQSTTFQHIVDSIPIPVAVTSPTGAVEWLNQPTLDYFGKTLEDLRGWKASDVVHPDDLERTIAAQTDAHLRGNSYDVESRHLRADGVYRWYNVLGLPLRNPRGDILRWFHLLIDIDDRKRAEESLRKSENNLQTIIDTIPALVWSAKTDGAAEFFNRHYLEYVGLGLEQVRDSGWIATVHPNDVDALRSAWAATLAAARRGECEARLLRFDGSYRWFLCRMEPLFDDAGNIVKWYGVNTDIEAQKRAEAASRANEVDVRNIIDSIPALAWSAQPDGWVDFVNEHYLNFTGMPMEELLGWRWLAAVHPDDIEGLAKIWRDGIDTGLPQEAEGRLRRHDGTYRWFLFRSSSVRDKNWNVIKFYGFITDIEDRKRIEQALAASEAEARLAMDSIDGMICLFTPEGVLNGGNRKLLEYFNLPLEEVMKWATNGITHPDDLQHCIESFMASVASGEPYDFETRFRRFDGVFRWFQIRGLPLFNSQGEIIRWYGLLTDIDDRKRAEEKLKHSQMLLAEGQRMSLSGTFSWLVDSDELTFSEELHRIFGFDAGAQITFEAIQSRVHPDDLPLLAGKMAVVRNGGDNPEYDIRLRMPDGAIKYLRVIGRLIKSDNGRSECIGAVQDVTQKRLAEQARDELRSELAHVTRVTSLGAMAASIAHEVNQPLSGIVTNASTSLRMLAANPPNLEGARETARRTIRDGNRAADVITRLRALFGKRVFQVEQVDLNEAVREVVAICWSDLLRARASLKTELAEGLPPVSGDRVQLQQVVMNLLRNSADAVAGVDNAPRHVVLTTTAGGEGAVRLSVSDSGVGFRTVDPDRVFDAFYSTKSDGMGIGLSVSRTIVESHGGKLWAEANEGPGATFTLSIPAVAGDFCDAAQCRTAT